MPEQEFIHFLASALWNAERNMRPGAALYIFYAGLHHMEFEGAFRQILPFKLHEQLVWVKSAFVLGRNSDYQWQHECCLYGWKTGAAHYFTNSRQEGTVIEDRAMKLSTMKKGELIQLCEKLLGLDEPGTVLRADKPTNAALHPTVKPQALLVPLIRNSSKKGWNVLDLFGGSGSTLIACEQTGRTCYMMELDPHYVDVIIARWEEFTGQRAELINGE
jgi:DNA modification methylase